MTDLTCRYGVHANLENKIWMVAPRFFPYRGGVERHALRVSQELACLGYSVTVITPRHEEILPLESSVNGVKVIRIPVKKVLGLPLTKDIMKVYYLKKVRNLISSKDIVHYHDFYYYSRWAKHLTPRGGNIFLTFHGYEGKCPPETDIVAKRQQIALEVNGHISIGHFINKWYGTRADIISYGGTDVSTPSGAPKTNHGCFVGRVEEDTGIRAYIDAVKLLKERGTHFVFEICGEGSLRPELEEYGRMNDLPIRWRGSVDNPQRYMAHGLFAFVSGYLSILEAMSAKRLVIATYDNPLKKDYLQLMPLSAKHMFIAADAKEIADHVERVIHRPEEAEEIIRNAYSWVRSITWQAVASDYLRLWGHRNL